MDIENSKRWPCEYTVGPGEPIKLKNFEKYVFSPRFDGLCAKLARHYVQPYTMVAKGGDVVWGSFNLLAHIHFQTLRGNWIVHVRRSRSGRTCSVTICRRLGLAVR